MGSKTAGSGGQGQTGDVPAFDMPPVQQVQPFVDPVRPPQSNGGWADDFIDRRPPNRQPFGQVLGQVMSGGMGGQQQMSPEDHVRMMYMSQLGRAPEQGGMDYWRQQMANGMTPDQVRDAFRASQEGQAYQQRMRPMMDDFGYGRPQQMPPEVIEALRLAQQRQQETPTYDPRVAQQQAGGQHPNVMQALALLGRLFG